MYWLLAAAVLFFCTVFDLAADPSVTDSLSEKPSAYWTPPGDEALGDYSVIVTVRVTNTKTGDYYSRTASGRGSRYKAKRELINSLVSKALDCPLSTYEQNVERAK